MHNSLSRFLSVTLLLLLLLLLVHTNRDHVFVFGIDSADVNSIWLDEYGDGKNFTVYDAPMIIVGDNENFRSFTKGWEPFMNWTVNLGLYTNLKTISHAVLGLYGTCAAAQNNTNGGCEGTKAAQYVSNLDSLVQVTVPLVPKDLFYEPSMELVEYCNDTIHDFIQSGCSSDAAEVCLEALSGTPELLNPLIEGAGDAHVVQYTSTIKQVREDIGEERWKQAIVAVLGGSQPRAANIEYGLWLRERGTESQGLTLFYMENVGIDDTATIFSNLETDLGDQNLSGYVFGDPFRMSEDLFANTTMKYVKEFVISGFPNPTNASIQSAYYRNSTLASTKQLLEGQGSDYSSLCPFVSGSALPASEGTAEPLDAPSSSSRSSLCGVHVFSLFFTAMLFVSEYCYGACICIR